MLVRPCRPATSRRASGGGGQFTLLEGANSVRLEQLVQRIRVKPVARENLYTDSVALLVNVQQHRAGQPLRLWPTVPLGLGQVQVCGKELAVAERNLQIWKIRHQYTSYAVTTINRILPLSGSRTTSQGAFSNVVSRIQRPGS